ncbi:toprim domain-containing protein [Cytophagaceae bacterium DM2B3-1]|uniref:Toprim domain-containing protein n=1 Tax=Xanthocytophaga flava TaxID=3048013 RepID=A0ABT7CJ15_9BACT|nr:toprim domain-containing protein [Xanthocytophaga flavus]MDJ1493721.1 toprim domain-containing protein [Xanthocytophaga flavus]
MKARGDWKSIEQIKALDIVDYLALLGYEPVKVRNVNYWYHSPLRGEKTPSFKVNRQLNCWYDHGIGKGGTIIDFGMLYYQCSIAEFLQKMNVGLALSDPTTLIPKLISKSFSQEPASESKLTILQEAPITSISLIRYLQSRCIPIDVARQFCCQVSYQIGDKEYYGIGFKNDSGGYEIRTPFFKASSSPKDITTITNSGKEVLVFEGFSDFLSYQTTGRNQPIVSSDFVILNSVSFFEKACPILEQYESIHLYLDQDTTGQRITAHALSLSTKYKDESHKYTGSKDLNEWLVHNTKPHRKNLKHKLS